MTRKDYVLISDVLKNERPDRDGTRWADGARDEWSTIAMNIARALASDNPRFDRARFLKACGVEA